MASIKPMIINLPLKTWHLGEINLKLPGEIKPDTFTFQFYDPERWVSKKHFVFFETRPDPRYEKISMYTEKPLDRYFFLSFIPGAVKFAEKDISFAMDQPAGLTMYRGQRESDQGILQVLGLDIIIRMQKGFLNFAYTEELDAIIPPEQFDDLLREREKAVIDMLKTFLADYKWTGKNEIPVKNNMATQYGYFAVDGKMTSLDMDMMSMFSLERPGAKLDIIVSIVFPKKDRINRYEFDLSPMEHASYNPNNGKVSLRLQSLFYVDSEVYGQIPVSILLRGSSNKDDIRFQSYVMGVYENIRNQFKH